MLAAATWAAVASVVVYPHLTVNSDESTYLTQAEALRHGLLFPPTQDPERAFVPWLSVVRDDHYVAKYTPVLPAIIAVGELVTGTPRAALAIIAGGLVLLTFLLASTVLDRRRDAVVAALFLAASPLVLVQTATFLPYAANLALLAAVAWTMARAEQRRSAPWLAAAGLTLGLAVFARPFDGMLFGAPFVLWLVLRTRQWRTIGWIGAGAAPPLALMLLFFHASTGSFVRSPFGLLDPSDTVGFGRHRMIPLEPAVDYGLALGVRSFAAHALLLTFWSFGGLVIVGLTLAGLRRSRGSALRPLAATALTIPLGYLFFWGTYNALSWGAPFHLGPYYWAPVLLPLAVLGARGFGSLAQAEPVIARLAMAGMLVLAVVVTSEALRAGRQFSESDRRVWDAVEAADLHDAVVFLPSARVGHPFQGARNDHDYDGDIVWAIGGTDCEDAAVLDAFPGRRGYRLTLHGRYRSRPPDPRFGARIRPFDPACQP